MSPPKAAEAAAPPPAAGRVRPARAWLALLAAALLGLGCKRAAAPQPLKVRVVAVEALDLTPRDLPQGGAISRAELVAALAEGLRKAGVEVDLSAPAAPAEAPAGAPARRGDFRLRMELQLLEVPPGPDTEGRGLMRAACRGRLQALYAPPAGAAEGPGGKAGKDEGPEISRFDQEALAEKVYQGKAPDRAAWAAHAKAAARDTAAALGAQLRLLGADRATLLAALGKDDKDGDNDLRLVAIQIAGARKEREAVPALVGLLRHPEMAVRDRAIGALIEIGDRRAVKAMAQSAQFSDTFELGKILEAVATIGGPEARSYLEFVASGHQSEQIRAEAKVALSHLEARERD